jgi:hypothetical protein
MPGISAASDEEDPRSMPGISATSEEEDPGSMPGICNGASAKDGGGPGSMPRISGASEEEDPGSMLGISATYGEADPGSMPGSPPHLRRRTRDPCPGSATAQHRRREEDLGSIPRICNPQKSVVKKEINSSEMIVILTQGS